MPRITVDQHVNASPQQVWELMSDATRYHEWVVPTDRVLEAPEELIELGSVYREHGGVPPFKADSVWHVTEFEPMRRQVHVGDDGSMTMTLLILAEPSGAGTDVTLDIEFKPRWYLAPVVMIMWPLMMGRRGREAMVQTIANFKQLAETGSLT